MTDPFLQEMIQSTEFVRETCDVSWQASYLECDVFSHSRLILDISYCLQQSRDGWWDGEYIEFIRQILKRKFLALLNEGIKLPNEAFDDLLDHLENYRAQLHQQQQHYYQENTTAAITQDDIEHQDGEDVEMEDQSHSLGQKKLTSLRSKGKRASKPKAKSANESFVSFDISGYHIRLSFGERLFELILDFSCY